MKSFISPGHLLVVGLAILIFGAVHSVSASQIFGTVYDNRQNALQSVDVELLDQYHSLIRHTVTDGVGRFTFDGLGDGTWYVRVLPFRYDFDEQTQEVLIQTISQVNNRQGYESKVVDFVLSPRKGTLAAAQAEVVFAQEIPSDARKAFEESQKLLKRGKADEAIVQLESALRIFPDYFLANHYLGAVYFQKKDYEHAAPPLMKAAQMNDKSGPTLYYLGYSLHELNYNKAAVVALKQAAILTPASPAVFTALGKSQRQERQYADAEKSLLQAKKLSKSENVEIYRELAAVYGETGQLAKGIDSLEQMLKSGNFSDADTAKIKEQIKVWKQKVGQQPAKVSS